MSVVIKADIPPKVTEKAQLCKFWSLLRLFQKYVGLIIDPMDKIQNYNEENGKQISHLFLDQTYALSFTNLPLVG